MNMRKLNSIIYPSYPIIITIIYVLAGIFFDTWHPTWLLFLTIPCYYMLVEFDKMQRKNKRSSWNVFPYPILCVILYLTTGFDYGVWHPMWIIFLTIPIYYIAVNVKNN